MSTILDLVQRAQYFLLRYETEHVPCTGITAVTRQERLAFTNGLMVAPWHSKLDVARRSLASSQVTDTGFRFVALVAGHAIQEVAVLLHEGEGQLPVIYLAVEGAFEGHPTPYDTRHLGRDALTFGAAVSALLSLCHAENQWVSGADWQTVPALELLHARFPTMLALHNIYDRSLKAESKLFAQFPAFSFDETVLQIGMKGADVVTAVSQGFAMGLHNDALHRLVMAPHLQAYLPRVVGVENAAFTSLSAEQKELIHTTRVAPQKACAEVQRMKTEARAALPATLQQAIRDRVVLVSMGRRSAQKQQDVLVESLRTILRCDPGMPIFTIFATTGGAPGAAARLKKITDLQAEFPRNVFCTDGLIDFYDDLMMAADLNVMPSLWEPHGSAFEGMVIPVARAVDGLLGQISPCRPIGQASLLSSSLHAGHAPNGFLFREEQLADEQQQRADFEALLRESPSPHNATFNGMVNALTSVLRTAVDVARADSATYVALIGAALTQQAAWSWNENFAMQVALMRDARNRRIDLPAMA